jgi:hypothetical protein
MLSAFCESTSPEHQTLASFFRASRARDTTILAGIAAVTFEPRTDGSVQQFEIVDFGEEQVQPDGRTIAKQVTIDAQVRTPDGPVMPRSFVVTMQRGAGERRWFITAVTPPAASRTSP